MSILGKKKVFVGLSGGVDSSVSAALLKKAGYDVSGVFIRVWNPASEQGLTLNREKGQSLFGLCQAADDRLDAMRVCAKLGIPFRELNLEKEYKRKVVDYMIREYKAGRTPNPDVFCNRFIKFGGFYKWAIKKGADFVATGHYAKIMEHESWNMNHKKGNSNVPCYMLHTSSDLNKDQSYFLWQIRKEQLPHILFPVGGMKKSKVRKLAKKFGLITADKKDSQGLCFVGKVDMKEFLSHYIQPKKGKILNEKGEVIGRHDGVAFYTIGERIGLATQTYAERARIDAEKDTPLSFSPLKRGKSGRWYIVAKDIKKNILTVSQKNATGDLPRARTEITIRDCNWISDAPVAGKVCQTRARYRQPLEKCRLASISKNTATVIFSKPQSSVAPGQSLVIYDMELLVGGGIIS